MRASRLLALGAVALLHLCWVVHSSPPCFHELSLRWSWLILPSHGFKNAPPVCEACTMGLVPIWAEKCAERSLAAFRVSSCSSPHCQCVFLLRMKETEDPNDFCLLAHSQSSWGSGKETLWSPVVHCGLSAYVSKIIFVFLSEHTHCHF